ncbi:MAG: hypothetical protein RRY23_07910 [Alistipes sp.]
MNRTIYIVILAALMVRCGTPVTDTQLDVAQAVIEMYPDSALVILRQVDTMQLSEAERARRRVLLSQAYSLTNVKITGDSLIGPALTWYERHGTAAERAKAWCYYAQVSNNANEQGKAVEGYTTALRYAETVRGDKQIDLLKAAANHNLGVLFDTQRYLEQAEAYFDRAATLYGELGEEEHRMFGLLMKSMVVFQQHRYNEAIALLESIREAAAHSENPELRVFVETYLLHYRVYAGASAPEQLLEERNRIDRKALDSLRRRNTQSLEENASLLMYDILCGVLFCNTGQTDSARLYLHRSLRAIDRFDSGTAGLLSMAANIAHAQGKIDSAYYYQSRYGEVQDSIYRAERTQQVAEAELRNRSQYEMGAMQAQQRYQLWIFLLVGLLVSGVLGWGIVRYRRRLRRREEQLGEYLGLLESYRESHDSLTSRLRSTDEREATVKQLLEGRMALVREIASTYYLYGETRRLTEKMRELALSPAMLADVVRMADLYNDNAVTRLCGQFPEWTPRNYDFAALVVAGFSPQEISVMLGMTLNGVYTLKSKLKRRIAESLAADKAFFNRFFE